MAATRVPNYYLIKKLSLQKNQKKGFKITEGFLYPKRFDAGV